MLTMGKVDISDLNMIITWAINISFQSPVLKWVSWTHTTPYILMTKVIDRTSSMLDTPPQDKLYRRLQVFSACEHSYIVMIMWGSKMSKTEYDLKAICILPMAYPENCAFFDNGREIFGHQVCDNGHHMWLRSPTWISLSRSSSKFNYAHVFRPCRIPENLQMPAHSATTIETPYTFHSDACN